VNRKDMEEQIAQDKKLIIAQIITEYDAYNAEPFLTLQSMM
jgi:hypothetical protein